MDKNVTDGIFTSPWRSDAARTCEFCTWPVVRGWRDCYYCESESSTTSGDSWVIQVPATCPSSTPLRESTEANKSTLFPTDIHTCRTQSVSENQVQRAVSSAGREHRHSPDALQSFSHILPAPPTELPFLSGLSLCWVPDWGPRAGEQDMAECSLSSSGRSWTEGSRHLAWVGGGAFCRLHGLIAPWCAGTLPNPAANHTFNVASRNGVQAPAASPYQHQYGVCR